MLVRRTLQRPPAGELIAFIRSMLETGWGVTDIGHPPGTITLSRHMPIWQHEVVSPGTWLWENKTMEQGKPNPLAEMAAVIDRAIQEEGDSVISSWCEPVDPKALHVPHLLNDNQGYLLLTGDEIRALGEAGFVTDGVDGGDSIWHPTHWERIPIETPWHERGINMAGLRPLTPEATHWGRLRHLW